MAKILKQCRVCGEDFMDYTSHGIVHCEAHRRVPGLRITAHCKACSAPFAVSPSHVGRLVNCPEHRETYRLWTLEEDSKIRLGVHLNKTMREIAGVLTDRTRNSVIGRFNRLKAIGTPNHSRAGEG